MDPKHSADLERILKSLGVPDLIELLTERISGSDLNTLLLKVFNDKAKKTTPGDLLKRYADNRFVKPATADTLRLKQLELDILRLAANHGVSPLQLSPVAPLGSASAVGTVDQNKVISALRGTEVVSDATNLMALHVANVIKNKASSRAPILRFGTTHRHVRAQYFGDAPGMLAHFHLFCMVTAGVDQGSYEFEKNALREHIAVYRDIFGTLFGSGIEIIVRERGGYKDGAGLVSRIADDLANRSAMDGVKVSIGAANLENPYYKGLQFTIKTVIEGKEHDIGDGGFVDWTQKMLGAKKERMLISAIGLDRLLGRSQNDNLD